MFRLLAELLSAFMAKQYVIRLTDAERERAARLSDNPAVPARVRAWATILLSAHEGKSDQQVAAFLGLSVATVQRTRKRCATDGFEAAIGWTGEIPGPNGHLTAAPSEWVIGLLDQTFGIDGAVGAAVVDSGTGTCLGTVGGGGIDLTAAATGNSEVVRAKLATIGNLRLTDGIEDILITLTTQYHLIRLLPTGRGLFLYVILDRRNGNLGMARHRLGEIEHTGG